MNLCSWCGFRIGDFS